MLIHCFPTVRVGFSGFRRCVALLALASLSWVAHAQTPYPNKPIRVVVPFAPGGATDIMARVVSKRLGEILGQTLVIDNKPGGNTALGADLVAKAPADGYTVLFTNDATFVLNPILSPQLSYNVARDFAPVATVAYLNLAMVVANTLPVNNMAEMVAWVNCCISSGFWRITCSRPGRDDVRNIELVRWNIMAEPPTIIISLTSGATWTFVLYLLYSSSNTPNTIHSIITKIEFMVSAWI